MNIKRREFIDRLLRISQLNQQLIELGDKGRQPAFTKRIKIIQMGKTEFDLPHHTMTQWAPRHNCKILVIDNQSNRYKSAGTTRSNVFQTNPTEANKSSPNKQEHLPKPSNLRHQSNQTINQTEKEEIHFITPIQFEQTNQCNKDPQKFTRIYSPYKNNKMVVSSAKQIKIGNEGDSPTKSDVQFDKREILSATAIKLFKGTSYTVQKQKKILEQKQKKSKLQKLKEINKNYAKPFIPPPKISAKSYIVCQITSEGMKPIVCFNSKNSQQVASLTKIMTCILTIEICQQLKLDIDSEEIKIGKYQTNIGGTSAELKPGQIYTVRQLLYGLMLPSGNDASLALAVWTGRKLLQKYQSQVNNQKQSTVCSTTTLRTTVQKTSKGSCLTRFIRQMNEKSKTLNMTKTKYANPHGLSNSNNRSTAYDIALLCHHALKNQLFRDIVSSKVYEGMIKQEQISNQTGALVNEQQSRQQSDVLFDEFLQEKRQLRTSNRQCNLKKQDPSINLTDCNNKFLKIKWQNTHRLLQSKPNEYFGIKTGVTTTAGPCLSSIIQIDNRSFLIVVLGCFKLSLRFKQTEILKRWVLKHEGIAKPLKKLKSLKVGQPTEEDCSETSDVQQSKFVD